MTNKSKSKTTRKTKLYTKLEVPCPQEWADQVLADPTDIFVSYLSSIHTLYRNMAKATPYGMANAARAAMMKHDPDGKAYMYHAMFGVLDTFTAAGVEKLEGSSPMFYYMRDLFVYGYPTEGTATRLVGNELFPPYMKWAIYYHELDNGMFLGTKPS